MFFLLAIIAMPLFLPIVRTTTSSAGFDLFELNIPVHVATNTTRIAFDTPQNQTEVTGLVQELFSATSNVSAFQGGSVILTASYNIYGELYVPHTWKGNGSMRVLEFAVHGLNLDHFYWKIGGPDSDLNYVRSCIEAGNSVFIFDRLGSGRSSKPDGIKDVQTATHLAVIETILNVLHRGVHGFSFEHIVGVGHSYGSFLLAGLVANRPNLVDTLVLTGFTVDTNSVSTVNAGLGLAIASNVNHTKFGSLSNSYLATMSAINLQQVFLHFPGFPQSALDDMNTHKGIISVGELLTRGQALMKTAANFTNSVLVVTGDKDIVECGGNCFQSVDGSANLLEPARNFFPRASAFETFIPAQTGHCLHAHFSAPNTYHFIHDWIARQIV